MNRTRRFLPVVVPFLLAACGGTTTTPAAFTAAAPRDARLLALVPADAMFVARLDVEALRRTTIYESASSMPGASPESVAGLAKIDRVLVSFGPMAEAAAAFEPEHAPPGDDGDTDSDGGRDADTDSDPDADTDGETDGDDEDESVPDPVSAFPVPPSSLTQSADAATLDFWQRVFGRNLPGFVILVEPHPGTDACELPFRDQTTREEGGLVIAESHGIAVFRTEDGLCGATLPSLLSAVEARAGMRSPAVRRLIAAEAAANGLGLLASATEGSGALLRGYIATASPDATPTEQRTLTWLTRMSSAWNRGIEGSTSVIALVDGNFAIDTRYAYEDERRASAHEVIADTLRELADATLEFIAAQSGGEVPQDVADRLRVERDGRELRVLWTLDEEHAAGMLESLLAPVRAGSEAASAMASAVDAGALDDWSLAALPVDERIARIEPMLPEIDGHADRAMAIDGLASAYVRRGRFDEAVGLHTRLLEAVRATSRYDAEREAHELARIAILRADYAEAERVLGPEVVGAGADAHVSVDGVTMARLRGDLVTANLRVAAIRRESYIEAETAVRLTVERALLLEAGGRSNEAVSVLDAALDLDNQGNEASSILAITYLEMLTRSGRMTDVLGELGDRVRAHASSGSVDELVTTARTSLVTCRARRLVAVNARARQACTEAVEAAVAAFGERHPDVAAARVELAQVLSASGAAEAQLTAATEALAGCSPTHPLRAEIARVQAAGGRRRTTR